MRTTSTTVVRIEAPHGPKEGTPAELYGQWGAYHEVVEDRRTKSEYRSVDGRRVKNGWWRWVRFVCNNTDCAFAAWVSWAAVERGAQAMIDDRLMRSGYDTTEGARLPVTPRREDAS